MVFTGYVDEDGRSEYETDFDNRNSELGDNWFWVDLNFEKYFELTDLNFSFFVEVNNLLDK